MAGTGLESLMKGMSGAGRRRRRSVKRSRKGRKSMRRTASRRVGRKTRRRRSKRGGSSGFGGMASATTKSN